MTANRHCEHCGAPETPPQKWQMPETVKVSAPVPRQPVHYVDESEPSAPPVPPPAEAAPLTSSDWAEWSEQQSARKARETPPSETGEPPECPRCGKTKHVSGAIRVCLDAPCVVAQQARAEALAAQVADLTQQAETLTRERDEARRESAAWQEGALRIADLQRRVREMVTRMGTDSSPVVNSYGRELAALVPEEKTT